MLCPLPALGVVTWVVWSDFSRPPRNRELNPMPEIRTSLAEVMAFAGWSLLGALVVAGLAAIGVALGRRLWRPTT